MQLATLNIEHRLAWGWHCKSKDQEHQVVPLLQGDLPMLVCSMVTFSCIYKRHTINALLFCTILMEKYDTIHYELRSMRLQVKYFYEQWFH